MPAKPMRAPWPLRTAWCRAEESEQAVDQPAEVTVGAVDQHFGPRNRQRCFFVRVNEEGRVAFSLSFLFQPA